MTFPISLDPNAGNKRLTSCCSSGCISATCSAKACPGDTPRRMRPWTDEWHCLHNAAPFSVLCLNAGYCANGNKWCACTFSDDPHASQTWLASRLTARTHALLELGPAARDPTLWVKQPQDFVCSRVRCTVETTVSAPQSQRHFQDFESFGASTVSSPNRTPERSARR